jgi:membrane-associated phospholipid phosphatase
MDNFWQILTQINLFFQQLGDWLFIPMRGLSFLGDEDFYLVVMPALYWCFDSRIGLKVGLLLMLSNGVNGFFKFLFHTPRPFWVDNQVEPLVTETSFGLPSGHSQNSAAIWGYFATLAKKRWLRILFILLIFFIGISRLYLGVHFVVDILAGWLIGGLLLWVFTLFFDKCVSWVKKWNTGKQWLGVFGSSALILVLPGLLTLIYKNWELKAEYLANIKIFFPDMDYNPFSMSGVITAAAIWFGVLAGLILVHKIIPLGRIRANLTQLFFRFVIGTIGVMIFWMGLKLVFPQDDSVISGILRFVRYGLVGLWVSAGAPYLFMKLGLETKIKEKKNRRR